MPGHIILVMFGFLMLTSGAATLSDAATPSNPDESKSSVNGLAKSSTPSASAFSNLFNTVESEALMDYIEALPKRTVKRLLDDDQLTDFVSAYENQIFNQDTVFGRDFIVCGVCLIGSHKGTFDFVLGRI